MCLWWGEAWVVEGLDGGIFDRTVHALDSAVGPCVVGPI